MKNVMRLEATWLCRLPCRKPMAYRKTFLLHEAMPPAILRATHHPKAKA
jgi:hypothetical protein